MTDFSKPLPLSDEDVAFPTAVGRLMPAMADIPEEFRKQKSPWSRWQNDWFFDGLKSGPGPGLASMRGKHADTSRRSRAASSPNMSTKRPQLRISRACG